jgi:SAM-dependent methyltransferase
MPTANRCRLCEVEKKFESKESHVDSGQTYFLYHCNECGGQFWEPFRNPGAEWYERDERYSSINADPYSQVNRHQKFVLDWVENKIGPKRLFDIGCGSGNFLAFAKRRSWQVAGIDFDSNAIQATKEVFGITDVEQTDLINYRNTYPNAEFELIAFFDVFEHIDNHREFLAAMKKLVVKDGYIAMSMPHRRGARWLQPNDLPPRHLTRWDEASLAGILRRNGFTPVYLKAQTASLNYVVLKLRFKYGRWFSFNLVNKLKKRTVGGNNKIASRKAGSAVATVSVLAKIKDWLIFGLPALVIWSWFVITRRATIGLVAIAQKQND